MFSKLLMLAGWMCLCSCSDDEKPVASSGGAGSHAAGSAGRSLAGEGGFEGGAETGGSAAGHGGSSTGGVMMGGAGGVAGGSVGGGGRNLGGANDAGQGGGASGAGGEAGSDENPYRACLGEDRTDNTCPVPGSICDADYGCEPPCPTGTVSCPAPSPGGTATAYCQQRFCRLDCGFGKTCPAGMTCDAATLFCTANGL